MQRRNGEEVPAGCGCSDGKAAFMSFRAWGDFMAAVWSTEEDKNYTYMEFYYDPQEDGV